MLTALRTGKIRCQTREPRGEGAHKWSSPAHPVPIMINSIYGAPDALSKLGLDRLFALSLLLFAVTI